MLARRGHRPTHCVVRYHAVGPVQAIGHRLVADRHRWHPQKDDDAGSGIFVEQASELASAKGQCFCRT